MSVAKGRKTMNRQSRPGDFLGTGWKFPPKVDSATGRIRTASEEEDIAEAIRIILFTRKGERAMRPDFGCGIQQYVFGQMDYGTIRAMEREITDAIVAWEPRVIEPEATVDTARLDEGLVEIRVSCVVRSTNNPYNLVFPYYIQEGM